MTCVYVSPHLDDAAFSCAAGIVSRRAAGQRVAVVTVFSRGEPDREHEDRRALARFGVEALHLAFQDSPWRLGIAPTFRNLMLEQPTRAETVQAVASSLRDTLHALEPEEIWWPLGIGGHVDHRTVLEASLLVPGPSRYYEDRPYAFVSAFARLRRAQLEGGKVDTPPTADALDAQIDAGGCAAFLGPDERPSCVQTLVSLMHRSWPDRDLRIDVTTRRYPGHGPAALDLVRAYPSQLRWIAPHDTADALWRRWAFDDDGEPFEREHRVERTSGE